MKWFKSILYAVGFSLCLMSWAGEDSASFEQRRQADSAFKVFKKDLRCLFSKQGCTQEQKERLLKEAAVLISTVLVLGGLYYGIYWRPFHELRKFKQELIAIVNKKTEVFASTKSEIDQEFEQIDTFLNQRNYSEAQKELIEIAKMVYPKYKKFLDDKIAQGENEMEPPGWLPNVKKLSNQAGSNYRSGYYRTALAKLKEAETASK